MEDKLQDEFMEFWDSKKDILGLGNYSDAVTKFWVDKMELVYKKGIEDVKKHLQVECLDYCEQQNGMDYCKNCGLSIDLIDKMK